MATLDQALQEAKVLTANLSETARQNQEANRSGNFEVSAVEQLASPILSVQKRSIVNNFKTISLATSTTSTSSSWGKELTLSVFGPGSVGSNSLALAAAQSSAAQQNKRKYNSGSCCCPSFFKCDDFQSGPLTVTLEDVEIRYGYDSFDQWDNEIYAFVVGRVSIDMAIFGPLILHMDFGGQEFTVKIPSPLKTGGSNWYSAVVDVLDPWPPPYHQVFTKGIRLNQAEICESKTLSVIDYSLGSNPFDLFECVVSEVIFPDPVTLEICPYIGTISIGEEASTVETEEGSIENVVATVSVDNLPFIFPLRVGVAYGDANWASTATAIAGDVEVDWTWGGDGPEPSAKPEVLEVTIGAATYRYLTQDGFPSNYSSTVFWAWDVFSKKYELQLILLDWRWNEGNLGEIEPDGAIGDGWEYAGPRWDSYYTDVDLWADDPGCRNDVLGDNIGSCRDESYKPPSPYGPPPTEPFPEPEPSTATFLKGADCYKTWVVYSINGGYSRTELPPKPEGCPSIVPYVIIFNYNAVRDDNFEIFLNGTSLGVADLSADGVYQAVLFVWTSNSDAIESVKQETLGSFNPTWVTTVVTSPAPGPGSPAVVNMQNRGDNGAGNRGAILVGILGSGANSEEYDPPGGQDYTANLTFPGTPPPEEP